MTPLVAICLLLLAPQSPSPAPAAPSQAPGAPSPGAALIGAWTLNTDLSDANRPTADRGDQSGGGSGQRGGSGGGGGRRGGGFGGRGMRGGGGGGGNAPPRNPDEMARMRDAMRDVMDASEKLTIVQTDSMVLVTGADGRTTRLSPDGKKIKDENTGIERKTKWDAGKLVSEIGGLGPGKVTQTFAVDPESHRLQVTVVTEGGRSRQPRTITHVYDKSE